MKDHLTLEQFNQEVAFLAILCGSKGIAEAMVLTKNKLKTPPTEEETNE